MSAPDVGDELSESRQIVLILRLVLDRRARLQHGALLDADEGDEVRFASLAGLVEAVGRWLDRQREHVPERDRPP